MALETTRPSRVLRRLRRVSSAIGLLVLPVIVGVVVVVVSVGIRDLGRRRGGGLRARRHLGVRRGDLTLTQQRLGSGDVALDLPEAGVVAELAGDELGAEGEQLLLRLRQAVEELFVFELAQLGDLGVRHHSSSARVTNLALIGSFWIARSRASRARGSPTPASSNMTRPGFTTATHRSGLPLPEPMRVSAGFSVTGLSGKMRIHTLPPRFTWRVMAIRAASIWRAVIHAGSRAWMQ